MPQFPQNSFSGAGAGAGVPQFPQNFVPSERSVPQFVHFAMFLPFFLFFSFFVETFQNRTIKKAYLLPAYKGGTPMPGLNAKKRVCQHTDIPSKRKWSPMKFGVFLCTHCLKIQRSFICQFLLICCFFCFLTFQVTKNQIYTNIQPETENTRYGSIFLRKNQSIGNAFSISPCRFLSRL